MKKIKLLFCFSLFIFSFSLSFGQSWDWGRASYGTALKSSGDCSSVTTDMLGNAYVAGYYSYEISFDRDTLNCWDQNGFLTKYDPSGNVIWAKQMIDTAGTYYTSVTIDKSGNVYITGRFNGNVQAGSFLLTDSDPNMNVFVAKYSTNGTVLWAKQGIIPSNSSTAEAEGYSVATDKSGNVFVTGFFVDTISFGNYMLKSLPGCGDMFLVKYDSSGNVLWVHQSQNPSAASAGYGYSVATDNAGEVYVAGYFLDTISFGHISLGNGPSFLVKYSSSGNVLWAAPSVTRTVFSYSSTGSVISDGAGNSYITGSFSDIVSFGRYTLNSPTPSTSVFLVKYDTNGNVVWARQSSEGWQGTGLAMDGNNYIYMTGVSSWAFNADSLKFDNYTLFYSNAWLNQASFLMKLDTMGNVNCGSILNNLGEGTYNGVASDITGNYIYTASSVGDTVVCGHDTLLPGSEGPATFLGRWISCSSTSGIAAVSLQTPKILLYPNPNNGEFTIVENGKLKMENERSYIEVYNMLGEKVYSQFSTLNSPFSINLSEQPNGIYLYRVTDGTGNLIGNGKFIIQK